MPVKYTVALEEQDLARLAAAAGPRAAAAALAGAEDAGADGYATVLHRLVEADPAAWTADVPGVLATLALPELGAFYLAATALAARHPDTFPTGPVPAALAALTLRRSLPASAAGQQPSTAVVFADQAVFWGAGGHACARPPLGCPGVCSSCAARCLPGQSGPRRPPSMWRLRFDFKP
ncbi:hypothetical protein ABR737_01710 [Streptomyces sp. Edi2]|uniref:hypothetical protein n=1 Tax=Streptomyces sp. Edi2 TaxID=3162528 RepID=UPI0033066F07